MAYAVIQTGGKQYRVAEGDEIEVEKLDVEAGTDTEFSDVLLVANGASNRARRSVCVGFKVSLISLRWCVSVSVLVDRAYTSGLRRKRSY